MKFEKHIKAMSGNDYILTAQVTGKLVEVEADPHSPDMVPVMSLALDSVEFSSLQLIRLYGERNIPLMAYRFESLAEAPSFIYQRDLNEFEKEAEDTLYEVLIHKEL